MFYKVNGIMPESSQIPHIYTEKRCVNGCDLILEGQMGVFLRKKNLNVETLYRKFGSSHYRIARCKDCKAIVDVQVSVPQKNAATRLKRLFSGILKHCVAPFLNYKVVEV